MKEYKKTLSIIIPCYNCARSVVNLLENIAVQITKEVELIVINDGSTDNTLAKLESFENCFRTSHIKYKIIDIENGGAANARTVGLSCATAKYVFFCDSDDSISKDFINNVFSCLSFESPDMIYFTSRVVDLDGNESNKVNIEEKHTRRDSSDALNYLLNDAGYTSAVWSFIFRRQLTIDSKIEFTDRKAHEDHSFTLGLIEKSNCFLFLNQALYFQSQDPGSLTRSKKDVQYIQERYLSYLESKAILNRGFNNTSRQSYDKWSIKAIILLMAENKKLLLDLFYLKFFLEVIYENRKYIIELVKDKARKR